MNVTLVFDIFPPANALIKRCGSGGIGGGVIAAGTSANTSTKRADGCRPESCSWREKKARKKRTSLASPSIHVSEPPRCDGRHSGPHGSPVRFFISSLNAAKTDGTPSTTFMILSMVDPSEENGIRHEPITPSSPIVSFR